MDKLMRQLLLVFVSMWLVACKPVDNHVLKIGSNDWLGYQPMYVAQSMNFFDQNEIDVVQLGSTTEVLRALYNGGLDGATLTLDEAIGVLDQGRKIKVLMVIDFSYGGDAVVSKNTIGTLAGLKGKRVAVERTAVGAVMLDAVLNKGDLTLKDITMVSTTFDEHEHIMASDQADAVITFEPARTKLLAAGFHELFNSREIPGTIIDVLVIGEDSLNKYPERIKRLMEGYFKARQLIVDKDAQAIASVSKRVGLNREAVLLGLEQIKQPDLAENKVLMQKCSDGFDGTVDRLNKIMLERKMIERFVSFRNACDSQIISGLAL